MYSRSEEYIPLSQEKFPENTVTNYTIFSTSPSREIGIRNILGKHVKELVESGKIEFITGKLMVPQAWISEAMVNSNQSYNKFLVTQKESKKLT